MSAVRGELDEIIQENVRRFRREAGMSQQKLADESGVSVDAVRKWEGKRGVPDRESVTKLAKALGRRMDDFNLREPPPPIERKVPAFSLKVADDAPVELRKLAEDYIEQLNKNAEQRNLGFPEGVRSSQGKNPITSIRSRGGVRTSDRPRQPESTQDLPLQQKRRRH